MTKEYYDNSMLTCFAQDCEFYYMLKYEHCIVPNRIEPATQFGKGIHAMVDKMFEKKSLAESIEAFRELVPMDLDDKRTVALGELITRDYYLKYENQPFDEIVSIEGWKEIEIDDFVFGGKIDKVIKWHLGTMAFDTKTTSKYLSQYVKTFDIKHQFTGYIAVCREHYENVSGLLVDCVFVPRPLKTKATETAFDRVITYRNESEIDEWRRFVIKTVGDIRQAQKSGFYRQFDNYCDAWNRECEYKQLCELYRSVGVADVVEFAKSSVDYKVEAWRPWATA